MDQNPEQILSRDKRWGAFSNDNTSLEEFISILPKIHFYDTVNQDVKEAFRVVHKLLVHSYFEYLFVDVAVTKALQTFEMALKLRYKEINNIEWNNKYPLKQLIEWFRGYHFFEREDKAFFDHVRNTRNYLSHPEKHHFAGAASFHWIGTAIDLINDLYENVELRKQRLLLSSEIKDNLELFLKKGAKLIFKGSQVYVYSCGHVLVNNKVNPVKVHFTLFKIRDIASLELKSPVLINCEITEFNFKSTKIIFDVDGNELILTNELDDTEVSRVEGFQSKMRTDKETVIQHNFLLFESHNFLLGTWRYIRHI